MNGYQNHQDMTFQPLKESTNQSDFLQKFNQMSGDLHNKSDSRSLKGVGGFVPYPYSGAATAHN